MNKLIKSIEEIDYHRNGVCGVGFHVVRFTVQDGGRFLATLFPGRGECAVICLDLLAEHGVKFGENSWRGDHYESELREAIEVRNKEVDERLGIASP